MPVLSLLSDHGAMVDMSKFHVLFKDDIIDKAIARKTKAQNLIEDIDNKVNTYIYKTKNYPKIQKELDQQSREAYRADVDLLKEIYRKQANKRSYNFFAGQTKGNTLSDAQVKFTRDLWDRIKAYHETPRGNLSKAKQNYFKQIDEILYNPYTDGQIALMKRLLKQIETPLSPNELAYGRVLKGQLANVANRLITELTSQLLTFSSKLVHANNLFIFVTLLTSQLETS